MHNLIIIGNGFDRAHNLPTSYTHFIEYIIKTHIKDPYQYKNLIEIKSQSSISDMERFRRNINNPLFIEFKNDFFKILVQDYVDKQWSDIEQLYFDQLYQISIGSVDKTNYKDPKILNDEFEIIKIYLQEYLLNNRFSDYKLMESFKHFFEYTDKIETTILNFNYTKTLQSYVGENHNVINIHGELSNEKNPIVFGYAADDSQSRALVGKGNEYMKNIKKHNYKRTNNIKRLTDFLDGTKSIDISILGHSCGLSDKLILNQIFNHDNVNSIRIFYHENYELYFQTQVNIDRIMNNDINFSKLLSYENESHRCPQYNDNEELVEKFKKYIDDLIEDQEQRYERSLPKVRAIATN